MSDTYNRYYHEHFTVHIHNRDINYVLEENCPYCKRSRRWLYDNNIREREQRNESELEGLLRISRLNIIVNEYNQVRDINSRINYIDRNVPNLLTYESLSRLPPVEVKTTLEEINTNSSIDIKKTDEPILCVICQDYISKNQVIRKIKCNHYVMKGSIET